MSVVMIILIMLVFIVIFLLKKNKRLKEEIDNAELSKIALEDNYNNKMKLYSFQICQLKGTIAELKTKVADYKVKIESKSTEVEIIDTSYSLEIEFLNQIIRMLETYYGIAIAVRPEIEDKVQSIIAADDEVQKEFCQNLNSSPYIVNFLESVCATDIADSESEIYLSYCDSLTKRNYYLAKELSNFLLNNVICDGEEEPDYITLEAALVWLEDCDIDVYNAISSDVLDRIYNMLNEANNMAESEVDGEKTVTENTETE